LFNLVVESFIRVNYTDEVETIFGKNAKVEIKTVKYITNLKKNYYECVITIGDLTKEELSETLDIYREYVMSMLNETNEFLGFEKNISCSISLDS
jgi:hypothetical protein